MDATPCRAIYGAEECGYDPNQSRYKKTPSWSCCCKPKMVTVYENMSQVTYKLQSLFSIRKGNE
ncbi:S-adenosyl-L-methionine-dependent tRNA 4-demethylwyosine synthase-like [Iris pallida]|uniref:S-adenosyl-L-methionine-dependent tRNA 4-demethylwyosine synthase-like n=1 Tax=Iris pallida TaxID=29817 RepID=A0AAX6GWX2_IRIPA|nr:S-adenosyl-L-methionine-dependent tRNA 4-demethylwyosine synthase-like [Iris pallida]KAJ6822738.1 S-adenosyl-L-methionine-dependent tRNA 4-demethylwyosine synthase-like [Iris pallida]KAJ6832805.1 S-adenosyl-L-methionine-dependent tRNA 4-demethylwyosine synthase-like [Iris pallida]